jgi:hypothetical protein
MYTPEAAPLCAAGTLEDSPGPLLLLPMTGTIVAIITMIITAANSILVLE